MKQDFYFSLNPASVNVDLMKLYAMHRKNGIVINVGVVVKN